MKPPMLHTAYKQTVTRNAYGDFISSAETAMPCHFRYITQQISSTADETVQADAMAWFNPNAGIDRQDILRIDDEYWRVERVIKARSLRNTSVQFIKTELLRYGVTS